MASVWYDSVPCCCGDAGCKQQITIVPHPESHDLVLRVKHSSGRQTRIRLAPGWARVLASLLETSAEQVKFKPPATAQAPKSPSKSARKASRTGKMPDQSIIQNQKRNSGFQSEMLDDANRSVNPIAPGAFN